jgi:hypothetical protein
MISAAPKERHRKHGGGSSEEDSGEVEEQAMPSEGTTEADAEAAATAEANAETAEADAETAEANADTAGGDATAAEGNAETAEADAAAAEANADTAEAEALAENAEAEAATAEADAQNAETEAATADMDAQNAETEAEQAAMDNNEEESAAAEADAVNAEEEAAVAESDAEAAEEEAVIAEEDGENALDDSSSSSEEEPGSSVEDWDTEPTTPHGPMDMVPEEEDPESTTVDVGVNMDQGEESWSEPTDINQGVESSSGPTDIDMETANETQSVVDQGPNLDFSNPSDSETTMNANDTAQIDAVIIAEGDLDPNAVAAEMEAFGRAASADLASAASASPLSQAAVEEIGLIKEELAAAEAMLQAAEAELGVAAAAAAPGMAPKTPGDACGCSGPRQAVCGSDGKTYRTKCDLDCSNRFANVDDTKCCRDERCMEYRGKENLQGRCTLWIQNTGIHPRRPDPIRNENFPGDGNSVRRAMNYCRNPDAGPSGLWCYTGVGDAFQYELCPQVPLCGIRMVHRGPCRGARF